MKRKIIPYNPILKERAKQLRKNMTLSEVLLWNELKQKKMPGYDFDRQRPIDHFIVAFYCKDLMLAIEIDGCSHDKEEVKKADVKRQKRLESLGVRFLRFDDREVKKEMTNVLRTIENWIIEHRGGCRVGNPPLTPPRRETITKTNETPIFQRKPHLADTCFAVVAKHRVHLPSAKQGDA
ncbi:MAG: endonuclease domain-containing protein [Bacteroidota bacterium]